MDTWEDFIAENNLSMEVYEGSDERFLPPAIPPESTVYRITLITLKDQEEFAVYYRGEKPTLASALSFLLNFALDGFYTTYTAWKAENEEDVAWDEEEEKAYYRYARDVYIRMKRLLGQEAFSEFFNS